MKVSIYRVRVGPLFFFFCARIGLAWALELGLAPWSRGVDPGPVPWSLGHVVPWSPALGLFGPWSLVPHFVGPEARIQDWVGPWNFFIGVARSGLACLVL